MTYNTVNQANTWALAHPSKNVGSGGPSWSGWCAALMFWAGNFDRSCDTATQGSYNSNIISTDPAGAPAGAFHWWRMGSEGHVALDLDGGGSRLLMASYRVSNYGTAIGTMSWAQYAGGSYAGWSVDFVGQRLVGVGTPAAPGGNTTSEDGMTLQRVAQKGGYTGPLDGVPGTNTWIGVQTFVRGYGYTGPIDGVPGINTWKAVQKLAQEGGYAGPIDGIPGSNTYVALNTWLAGDGATPPTAPTGPLGIYGIDVATTQRDLNFSDVRSAGFQFAIVKAGGTNVSPIYVAPYYQRQVDRARAAALNVGHYWVAGSADPIGDANFFVDHLFDYRDGDILALDNEAIDDGIFWDDTATAEFMQTVKNRLGRVPFLYTYSSLLTSNSWTQTKALGAKLWVAHYTSAGNPSIGTAFPSWAIHQYSSSANIGGIPVDVNIARLSAFDDLSPVPYGETAPPTGAIVGDVGASPVTSTHDQGVILQKIAARGGYTGALDGVPGANTWKGVQQHLRALGYYGGAVDGVPGTNTYKGLQLLAADYGYEGPIDGVPGSNTFAGLQNYLDASQTGTSANYSEGTVIQLISRAGGYLGSVDGVPGANTWKGMQQVLAGYVYTGPVDGQFGSNSWKSMQRLAAKGGYSGVIDGIMGSNSWKGVQTIAAGFGYTGPIDGAPGTNTYLALQRLARLGGYTGPVDGYMGPNSWKGLQTLFAGLGYTGPIDGIPGANTYKSLQTLAARGGYSGPIDGIPGPRTYAGLSSLVQGATTGGSTGIPTTPSPTIPPSQLPDNSGFLATVSLVEKYAKDYKAANTISTSAPSLVAQWFRQYQYGYDQWAILLGIMDQDWLSSVTTRARYEGKSLVRTYNLAGYSEPQNPAHFFATMDAYLIRGIPGSYTDPILTDTCGWAGDLITLLVDYVANRLPSEGMYDFARRYAGSGYRNNSFDKLDLRQDADAFNAAYAVLSGGSLSTAINNALGSTFVVSENTYKSFVRRRFGTLQNARIAAGNVLTTNATNGGIAGGLVAGARVVILQNRVDDYDGAVKSVSVGSFSTAQLEDFGSGFIAALVDRM